MTAAALLADLAARDVRLALAEGGALTYDAPPGALTDADREAVAAHRAALVALLAAAPEPSPDTSADRKALLFEPQAALVTSVTAACLLPWLRSARAGSAPEAGLAWLEARARDLAPGLGPEDRDTLVARVLGRLCASAPSPGRELAREAWDRLGGLAEEEPACESAPGRPLLFHRLEARELAVLVPAPLPPEGLPEACPACRSPRPKWKALVEPGRYLCSRCWSAQEARP